MRKLIALLAVAVVFGFGVAQALPPATGLQMWFSATEPNYEYRLDQTDGNPWTLEGAWLNLGSHGTAFDAYTSMWSGHRLCSGWNPSWREDIYLGDTFSVFATVNTWGTREWTPGGSRGAYQALFHGDYLDGGAFLGYDASTNAPIFGWSGVGGHKGPAGTWPNNTDQIVEFHVSNNGDGTSNLDYYLNGALVWNKTVSGTTQDKTGNMYWAQMEGFDGASTDILYYKGAMTEADIAGARTYLSEQSGVPMGPPIAEPAGVGLLGLGLLGLAGKRKRA